MRKNSTNLNSTECRGEDRLKITAGSPRPDVDQKGNGVKGRRLDKCSYDGPVHPASPVRGPCSSSNVFGMQDESYDDHGREEGVEENGNRIIRYNDVIAEDVRASQILRLHGRPDIHDPHR